MEVALYEPGLGYYVRGAAKLGAEGDFVTAPEISPLFGRTLARQIAQLLERSGGQVLELGAGSGTMAADVLGELQNIDRLPRRYQILETSPQLVARPRQPLQRRGPALEERGEWVRVPAGLFDCVVSADE